VRNDGEGVSPLPSSAERGSRQVRVAITTDLQEKEKKTGASVPQE